jgi:hypothetical protein
MPIPSTAYAEGLEDFFRKNEETRKPMLPIPAPSGTGSREMTHRRYEVCPTGL